MRKLNEDDLDHVLRAWTSSRDRWELATLLQKHGIAAASVENILDMLARDPNLKDHFQHVRQPSDPDVDIVVYGEPIRFDGHRRMLTRAPMMGEHNEYVLCETLGMTEQEFDELVVEGIIN